MFCSQCGAENPEGAKFCSKCGARLGVAATPTEGAAKPEAESSTGLSANVAGLLCYVAGWITGIVFIVLEKKSIFVKFHAWQSIMTFGVLTVIQIILSNWRCNIPLCARMVDCTCPGDHCLGDNRDPVDYPYYPSWKR